MRSEKEPGSGWAAKLSVPFPTWFPLHACTLIPHRLTEDVSSLSVESGGVCAWGAVVDRTGPGVLYVKGRAWGPAGGRS